MTKLDELLENVRVGARDVFTLSGTPGDRKVTVERRDLLPEAPRAPTRAESLARSHLFHTAEALAAYVKEYGGGATVVLADAEVGQMQAVLDETAEEGREVLTMAPAVHPLWAPWARILGRPAPLRDFAQHVAANRRVVVEPPGRELQGTLAQVRASISTTIETGRGKDALNGVLVKTRIQGVEKDLPVELPETLVLSVPLFVGTPPVELELDLCLEVQGDGVVVLLGPGTYPEAKVAAFEGMVAAVRAALPAGAVVALGRVLQAPWAYLPEPKK